jgi:hypothetical protein
MTDKNIHEKVIKEYAKVAMEMLEVLENYGFFPSEEIGILENMKFLVYREHMSEK